MPYEKDVDERVWCPGPWPWEWFDTCIERKHKWCYHFSWVKRTAYVFVVHHEACEAGKLFTWDEGGLGIGTLDTFVPLGEMCFDSPRSSKGVCDSSNTGLAASPLTAAQQQGNWRFCYKCNAMFFDGYPDKGICPGDDLKLMVVGTPAELATEGRDVVIAALVGRQLHVRIFDVEGRIVVDKTEDELTSGHMLTNLKNDMEALRDPSRLTRVSKQQMIRDVTAVADYAFTPGRGGHAAAGFTFVLPHDMAGSQWAQPDWRYCQKCHAMFFDGYADKGVCPKGAGHSAQGFNFVLPHDVSESAWAQRNWRYCHKCHVMFFNGYRDKGVCAARGSHVAAGFNFVLGHN